MTKQKLNIAITQTMEWNKTMSWRSDPSYIPIPYSFIPPCNSGCPIGNDCELFILYVAHNDISSAWQALTVENPLPYTLGSICYHPCEEKCNRGHFDESLNIAELERYVGEIGIKENFKLEVKRPKTNKKIAIVGGGVSGVSCAYYLATLGHDVKIFEKDETLGGVLQNLIPSYKLNKNKLNNEISRIIDLGVTVEHKIVTKDFMSQLIKDYDAVFIAIGCQTENPIDIAGGNSKNVISDIAFLKSVNKKSDLKLDKSVAVIGNTINTIEAARLAKRFGAKVTIICKSINAPESDINQAVDEGIEFVKDATVLEIKGSDSLTLNYNCKGHTEAKHFDNIIVSVSNVPDFDCIPDDIAIDKESNLIKINEYSQTSVDKVFAGGDATSKDRSIVGAMYSGKKAAIFIDAKLNGLIYEDLCNKIAYSNSKYLMMEDYFTYIDKKKVNRTDELVTFEDIKKDFFKKEKRINISILPVNDRIKNFEEIKGHFNPEEATSEAKRCFHCGNCIMCDRCYMLCPDAIIQRKEDFGYSFNYQYCKGCGLCADACPRAVIRMGKRSKK